MSNAARSLFVFGVYAVLAGLSLLLVPGIVLAALGFPPASDGWVRVVGVLAVCVGVYHVISARHELQPYLRASVVVRLGFAIGLSGLVVTAQMPRALFLFAAADLLGAVWTAFALRSPREASAAAPAV
jgi:hypothetical protein